MSKTWWLMCGVGLVLAGSGPGRADDAADMRALIDKSIQAVGGAKKVAAYPAATWKTTGKFYGLGEGIPFTGQQSLQHPGQMCNDFDIEIMGQTYKIVQVINGDKGWIKNLGKTVEMKKQELDEAREQLYVYRVLSLVPLRDKGFELSPLGELKVGNRTGIGVRVASKGHRDVNLYFDKENSRLLKSEARVKDPQADQEFSQETLYEDYKEAEGILHPNKFTINRDGKKYLEFELSDYKPQEKLDESVFAKP